ncbi:MAG: ABC transporter ATP-binding protein [Gammaproteobacteria bacterium]
MNQEHVRTLPTRLNQFILYFMKEYWLGFLLIGLFGLAWSIDNTIWPYFFKILIDKFVSFNGDKTHIWSLITPLLLWWAGLWLLIEVMFRGFGFLLAYVIPRMQANIRMAMFDYVEEHSYDFFANNFAGSISNKINDMTQSVTNIIQLVLRLFIPALAAIIIATSIFYTRNHLFALLLAGWCVLHLAICFATTNWCARLADEHSTSRSLLTGKVVDNFGNIANVKLFARRLFEYSYLKRFQHDELTKQTKSMVAIEYVKILLGISSFIFPGVALTLMMIYSWQQNWVTIGDLVLIFNTNWNIMMITWISGSELPNLFKEVGTARQALQVISVPHAIQDKPNASTLKVTQGHIQFEHVNFSYVQNNLVFDDFSVDIAPGSKVGLVGFSGSGKTTFVNLMLRFFDINAGRILIDGTDIAHVTRDSLRSQIAMIPQDPTLFHRTLLENIYYGRLDASMDEILAAARHAHCEEFINTIPGGYQALVGERGIKLSGGQRQRIAIARAILKDAPILILDEATSALDSVTEKLIQDALRFLMKNRTTIVVAHRLSTLADMDRILVFDHGKIIEDGTHEELLQRNGHYAHMWRMQAGGFLPDKLEAE